MTEHISEDERRAAEEAFGRMIGGIRSALYDQANAAIYTPPAKVLGWRSPWNGDEHTPRPRSYWLWLRLYVATRKARHLVGLHDWDLWLTHPPRRRRCTWCGTTDRLQRVVTADVGE